MVNKAISCSQDFKPWKPMSGHGFTWVKTLLRNVNNLVILLSFGHAGMPKIRK